MRHANVKPHSERQKSTGWQQGGVAPRFQIEKLEERIAPRRVCGRTGCYNYGHYNPQGKYVGGGRHW